MICSIILYNGRLKAFYYLYNEMKLFFIVSVIGVLLLMTMM